LKLTNNLLKNHWKNSFFTKIMNVFLCCIIFFASRNIFVDGFYVPGVAPQDFVAGATVDVKVIFEILFFLKKKWPQII
jgi:hypothetical protein